MRFCSHRLLFEEDIERIFDGFRDLEELKLLIHTITLVEDKSEIIILFDLIHSSVVGVEHAKLGILEEYQKLSLSQQFRLVYESWLCFDLLEIVLVDMDFIVAFKGKQTF